MYIVPILLRKELPTFPLKTILSQSLPHILRGSDTLLQLQNWVQSGCSEAEYPFPLEMG